MVVCKTISELHSAIEIIKTDNQSIGFVPTMGALHQGHLELIKHSSIENPITVCSIFVNPIQFNNTEDLHKYPRTPEKDMELINPYCNILFMPSVKEMYPDNNHESFNFGKLETVMEGAFRPGHFEGVAIVVSKLFKIVKPQKAYFGEKDFQQMQIIKAMTKQINIPVEIISCPIVREKDGLAMSSRNMRLSENERKVAPLIYQTLISAKEKIKTNSAEVVKQYVNNVFNNEPLFKLEYFEIADTENLQPINHIETDKKIIACIAVWLGKVRLIDNIILN